MHRHEPNYTQYTFKNDRFRKDRGGQTAMITVLCRSCGTLVLVYQKDGYPKQALYRCYLDRIFYPEDEQKPLELFCPGCRAKIGTAMIYKKENRPAYGLLAGTFVYRRLANQGRFL